MFNNLVKPPEVLLLIAPGCPHCPGVMKNLTDLLKEGEIGHLEIYNIAIHPEIADSVGTRSVPWMRIGKVELTGLHSQKEIREWLSRATASDSPELISHLLETNRLEQAIDTLRNHPEQLAAVIQLLADEETSFSVRIGIGAAIEELEHSDTLETGVDALLELTHSGNHQLVADAAHYLGFTQGTAAVITRLETLVTENSNAETVEIAHESLANLQQHNTSPDA